MSKVDVLCCDLPAGGNVEVVVRLMPLSIGKFEVLVPLGVDHSQEPIGLLLSGSVQGLQIRCSLLFACVTTSIHRLAFILAPSTGQREPAPGTPWQSKCR